MLFPRIFPCLLALGLSLDLTAQPAYRLFRNDRINARAPEPIRPDWAPFYHGVASGDPLTDRVIIWTRVTPEEDMSLPVAGAYLPSGPYLLASRHGRRQASLPLVRQPR